MSQEHIEVVRQAVAAAELVTVRGGKIVRAELGFADKGAALEAAALSE
jgi:hypothetical protein